MYSPEHASAGQITAADRDGVTRSFPMLTLSVAALDSETFGAASADSIANLLTHVKNVAKQRKGNSFVLRADERVFDLLAKQTHIGSPTNSAPAVGDQDVAELQKLVG